MLNMNNKKICFMGRGDKIDKEELETYFLQNSATMVETLDEADIIIEGKFTPIHLEDKIYALSKDGIEVVSIETLEHQFSANLDSDSVIIAIKMSKDKERLIKLLNNHYFTNETFIKLLKFYDWENTDIYDTDDNRDVSTAITTRFCTLTKTNHNIQHSPIGVYYTALETTEEKLLDVIYNMPNYKISDKNAKEDQPLTLKEVVALNPNNSKIVQMQILTNGNLRELIFLAQNTSISKTIVHKLLENVNEQIILALIKSNNLPTDDIKKYISNDKYSQNILQYTTLDDDIFKTIIKILNQDIDIVYLSSNNSLNQTMINKLFEFDVENSNINLLKNNQCPSKQISKFLNLNNKIYNITIAHNESLNAKIYQELLNLNDLDVDISLGYNIQIPNEIIEKLYLKNDFNINTALSTNIATPIHILMQLQLDNSLKSLIAENETYRAFSRKTLGIINEFN
ncbi:MAG: hypothetical protein HOB89_00955 [Campylobacteraceae bacterium]|nr:hypothetical protein [Campylobacteraceae bacterium]